MGLDPLAVSRAFSRAAERYDQHAALQVEVGERLLERLGDIKFQPQRVLDLGCGTGIQSQALKAHFPDASIVAMDLVMPMLKQAGKRRGWWRKRFDPIAGNAMHLPLASATFDLVYSNLMLPWCDDAEAVLANLRRILKPGGLVLLSTFGLDTLTELRQAWAQADNREHVGRFTDVQRLGSALTRAGFAEPVLDTDWLTTTYTEPRDLLEDLKGMGATYAEQERRRGLSGPRRLNEMINAYRAFGQDDGRYPATWEVVYASAWAPDEGQPIRTGSGEEASFSVASLKVRRR